MSNIAYDECEIQIISGLLNYGTDDEDCKKALEVLTPDDFEHFASLFEEMQKQYKDKGKFDTVQALKDCCIEDIFSPYLVSRGITDYSALISSSVTTANMKAHTEMLKERTNRRRIQSKMQELLFLGQSDDILDGLNQLVEQENKRAEENNVEELTIHKKQYETFLNDIYTPYNRKDRIWTGFSSIDRCLCGLRKGSISMVGARPSSGKTTFALNVAVQQMKDKSKTILFSLEMSASQILERLLANVLEIPYGLFNNKAFNDYQKKQITTYLSNTYSDNNFLIRDDVYTIEDISRIIAKSKPDMVIIDFLTQIQTLQKTNTRREAIDYISAQIKQTAKRYNCHIMTLSQLARATRDTKDKPPTMSELKESGALEQDNDYIMLLHRPHVIDKSKHKPEETTLIIDKNKYGTTGIKNMNFNGAYQRFNEIIER